MLKDHLIQSTLETIEWFLLKENQVEIQPAVGGPTEMKHVKHVKHALPADRYVDQLPDYSRFGRKTTLRINPNQILDLHWKLANTYHTTNVGQLEIGCTTISVHDITVKTFNDECIKWCETILSTKTCTTQSRQEPAVVLLSLLPNYTYLLKGIHYYH